MAAIVALKPELEAIQAYCREKNMHVFNGELLSSDFSYSQWDWETPGEWRQFIDFANAFNVQVLHLSKSIWEFDDEEIDEMAESCEDEDLTLELIEEAKSRHGEPASLEISFILNNVQYVYYLETDWARLLKQPYDEHEDDDEEAASQETQKDDEQEVEEYFTKLISLPEFKGTKTNAERHKLALDLFPNVTQDTRTLAFKIAIKANRYHKKEIQAIEEIEKITELRRMRTENPKLTKVAAEAALGVSKRGFQRLWLMASVPE
ncbi:hypothetical protein [Flaviaesturariibacter amylovorans]|uniref:Uncharacterized protein n=1 Tax=Flaviaesturariibacter amylovorans TaxID=1084520 RepID=A0ABP8H5K6_9BACT